MGAMAASRDGGQPILGASVEALHGLGDPGEHVERQGQVFTVAVAGEGEGGHLRREGRQLGRGGRRRGHLVGHQELRGRDRQPLGVSIEQLVHPRTEGGELVGHGAVRVHERRELGAERGQALHHVVVEGGRALGELGEARRARVRQLGEVLEGGTTIGFGLDDGVQAVSEGDEGGLHARCGAGEGAHQALDAVQALGQPGGLDR